MKTRTVPERLADLVLVAADQDGVGVHLEHRLVVDPTAVVRREPVDPGPDQCVADPQIAELLLVGPLVSEAVRRARLGFVGARETE
jgi:hypothetical protein